MNKKLAKRTSLLIAILFVISMMSSIVTKKVAASEVMAVATWEITTEPKSAEVTATGGEQKDKSWLNTDRNITGRYSTSSLCISGWDEGKDKKYWIIGFSSKGFKDMTLEAKTRSSGTGPRDFKVQYSLDNLNYTDIENSEYSIKTTKLKDNMGLINIPQEMNNKDKVYLRIIMTSNTSLGGSKDVASTGTSNINNIYIKGTQVAITDQVSDVIAEPSNNSKIKLGDIITLKTITEGATIKYSINGSDEKVYDNDKKIIITELPATIEAYATKEGLNDSKKSVYNYTQAQVDPVTATPNGGTIKIGDSVTLKCTTIDAAIKYSLDNGNTYLSYKEPIIISKLPIQIDAKAICDGMIDSIVSTFKFKERVVGEGYTPYFGQLHSHTNNSDGIGTVEEAYKHAQNVKDMDFLAVTDHSNSFEAKAGTANIKDGSSSTKWLYGKDTADKCNIPNKFIAMYGYEMTWSNGTGHINTYNTDGFENRNNSKYKSSTGLKEYYDTLKTVPSSISQFNHPGPTFGDFNDFAHYDPIIDNLITLVEVGNGEGPIGSNGYFPSYEYYQRALDKGWHLAPTNNQDNHKGKWGDANTARSVLLASSLDREDLYDAMRNRRGYATEDQNLKIDYTLNNEVMGTILNNKPEKVSIKVAVQDPDNEELGTLKVITNGGKVLEQKSIGKGSDNVSFNLPNDNSFYYIRIDQKDGDIAVTAPVWTGDVLKAGISKTTASTELPVKGEKLSITSSLFNNETEDLNIKSIEYSIDGKVINASNESMLIKSLSEANYSFDYVPDKAGTMSIKVKVVADLKGSERIFTDVLKINVADPKLVTKVVIDGSHYNDYVSGYYNGNMGNFIKIGAKDNVKVEIADEINDEVLKDASIFVISAPAKKDGNKNNVTYKPCEFSDEFIDVVKRYVDNGGNLIVCGLADYQDNRNDDIHQTSTQLNKLLKAIGATTIVNNDEVVDNTNNAGQPYRLKFKNFNMNSPYMKGVVPEQEYSFYSGCSIILDEEAVNAKKVEWLVNGFETTESLDANKNVPAIPVKQGDVCVLASEKLSGGGTMIIGGTVFLSNFEVQAQLDNTGSLQYVNYNVVNNFMNSVKRQIEVSKIADVRKGTIGDVFCVEGTVTAGTEEGNAFFDTIYVQDETGGINIFPINDGSIKVGQKVKVIGSLDEYQGDLELRVISSSVIDTNISKVDPTDMSISDALDYDSNGGMLAKVQGVITKVHMENGLVSYFTIKDKDNNEMRIFIDGYIGYSDKPDKLIEEFIKSGNEVSAIGLISKDSDGTRLRVRDKAEILLVKAAEDSNPGSEGKPGDDGKPGDEGKPGDDTSIKDDDNDDSKDKTDNTGKPSDSNKHDDSLVETGRTSNSMIIFISTMMILSGAGIYISVLKKKRII